MDIDNWYYSNRGIKSETLDACEVTRYADRATWLVGGATKVRENFGGEGRDRKMYYMAGEAPRRELWWTPYPPNAVPPRFIIVEGETDGMRGFQELPIDMGRVGALSGVNFYDEHTFDEVNAAGVPVYFVFDNDGDDGKYANEAVKSVNASWERIRKLVPKAKRVYLPTGYKDLCNYLDVYGAEHFAELLRQSTKPRFQYTPLDLTKESEPPVWLWDTKMARGDIIVVQAAPNMGKSMIMLGLCIAIAEGKGEFLGLETISGKALIIDQENPEDDARRRCNALGLTTKGVGNLRYLHEQGVRLDRDPEKLYLEAEAFTPDVILLDSLTRLHTEDENSAGAVSRLFNEAIHPLARKIGATVIIIHHVNKTSSGDSFTRSRGSSDIGGAIDTGFDLVEHTFHSGPVIAMCNYKNRRGPKGSKMYMKFVDKPEGKLDIVKQVDESVVL